MTKSSVYPGKLFTLEEANRTLPLVSVIVQDLVAKSREVAERRHRLQELTSGRSSSGDSTDLYSEELEQIQSELERDIRDIAGYEEELRELGIECKDVGSGIVQFPAMINGEIAHLCWKLGDSEVRPREGSADSAGGQQPLADEC